MDIQNTQSQMRKGVLEFCILSIIRQGEVYPSDIVEILDKIPTQCARKSGKTASPGYRELVDAIAHLHQLEKGQCIKVKTELSHIGPRLNAINVYVSAQGIRYGSRRADAEHFYIVREL